jgi:hypothetical protein
MMGSLATYLAKLMPKTIRAAGTYGAPAIAMGGRALTKGYETLKSDPLTALALMGSGGVLGYELGNLEDANAPGKGAVTRDDMRKLMQIIQGGKAKPFGQGPGRPKMPRDEDGNIIR